MACGRDPSTSPTRARRDSVAAAAVRALAGAFLLAAAACAPVYPPVADTGGDLAFKARIAMAFGPGTSAARLRAVLLADGFTIVEDPRIGAATALFRPANGPCGTQVRIDWREDRRGRVTVIQAGRQACT